MKHRLLCILSLATLFCTAYAAEKKDEGRYAAKPLKGDYYIYGGTLGEMLPPTKNDKKVSFMFTGPLAKEFFDQIGPDIKDSCSSAPDYRERTKGDLSCTYTKDEGYACHFGLDAKTGKSTYGSIC